jgi:fatty acyl-CoA reductase
VNPESSPPTDRVVLITGGTGFLGKVVLADLVRHQQALGLAAIYVLIRSKKGRSAQQRFAEQLVTSPAFRDFEPGWHERVIPIAGDAAQPLLGFDEATLADVQPRLTHIVHCAASVDFNLPVMEALQANVTSALAVQAFAEQCPALQHLLSVSTAYVQPHRDGPLPQALLPLPQEAEQLLAALNDGRLSEADALALCGHPNTYTFTKCLAEHLLLARRQRVPVTLLRPSIISVAQQFPHPGWIDSSAALAGFFLCFAAGYLRVISGDRQTRLDVVPVDQVAAMIRRQAFDAVPLDAAIVHAAAGPQRALPLGRLAEVAVDYFKDHPQARPIRLKAFDPQSRWREWQHWWHHLLPLRLAGRWARVSGNRTLGRQAGRLEKVLESVFRSFQYFTHRTYHFELSEQAGFEMPRDPYIRLVCEGTRLHLLAKLQQPQPARRAQQGASSTTASDDSSR